MPAVTSTTITTMTTAIITMDDGPNTPPSLAGLGREADQGVRASAPPCIPLPQAEGECVSSISVSASPHALLHLLTWLSPAFPTGAFAYSHGLEWAVEAGDITDGDTLRDWLSDVLAHGAARSDAILLRHAHKPDADLDTLAALAAATAPTRERYTETHNQGAAFMRAARPWGCPSLPDPVAYPVAVGALAGLHLIDADATTIAYLHAVTASLISAAVRLVPLGQSTGLAVLAALEPIILRVASETRSATLDDLGGAVFRSDLAAMRHETQYTRLFRS
jgi:urease accessory protein